MQEENEQQAPPEVPEECDIDDLACQMSVLSNLQGIENSIGTEPFRQRFPELANLPGILKERIRNQERVVNEGLQKCAGTAPLPAPDQEPEPESITIHPKFVREVEVEQTEPPSDEPETD